MNKEILKHYYEEGKKFGYALARGATDLPSVQTFDELYTAQLQQHGVVRGGDNETESVQRVEHDFNGRNVMKILYTPTEPLPAAEVAQNGRDGLCNCVNQFFGYINCGYDCQRNKE